MGKFVILWAALALWLAVDWAAADAERAEVADGVAFQDAGGAVLLDLPLSKPVPWRVWLASDPPRLVVELGDTDWTGELRAGSPSISEARAERMGEGKSRLVAHLLEPFAVDKAEMVTDPEGSAVLKVTLAPTTGAAFDEAARPMPLLDEQDAKLRPVVVIDPGHGGRDPGADAGSASEAALMLEIAMLLRADLLATGLFEVVLTRDSDVFVPLEARITRARAALGDVFLSLHADRLADETGHASGVTVYTLAADLAAEAADRQVERHRAEDVLMGVDLSGAGDDVALALMALQRRGTEPRTAALSKTLIGAFEAAGLAVNNRPERQGDFAVLKAAGIPSVLIELGFLSSEADLARLSSERWRRAASAAMRDGILQWMQEDRALRHADRP